MFIPEILLLTLAQLPPAYDAVNPVSVSHPGWGGVAVEFKSSIQLQDMVVAEKDHISRLILDRSRKIYFGYNLSVERISTSKTFRLRVQPLTITPGEVEGESSSGWTRISLPQYPVIPELSAGSSIRLELLVNPNTGEKIWDRISLNWTNAGGAIVDRGVRDISLDDIEMTLNDVRFFVNGSLAQASKTFSGGIVGANAWVYLKGQGRFVFSLRPRVEFGFRKSGELAGTAIAFSENGMRYRVECSQRIVPASGRFPVYVLHDSAWRPQGSMDGEEFLVGAADRIESVLQK